MKRYNSNSSKIFEYEPGDVLDLILEDQILWLQLHSFWARSFEMLRLSTLASGHYTSIRLHEALGVVNIDFGISHSLFPISVPLCQPIKFLGGIHIQAPGKIPETSKSLITLSESLNFFNKKEINFTSPSSHRPRSSLDIPRSAKSSEYWKI